jgi:hypothetical protein
VKLVKTSTRPKEQNSIPLLRFSIFDSKGRSAMETSHLPMTAEYARHWTPTATWIRDNRSGEWSRIMEDSHEA